MPKLDGTGNDSVESKQGLEAFQDAKPQSSSGSGQGEGGTGTEDKTGRSGPLKGGK